MQTAVPLKVAVDGEPTPSQTLATSVDAFTHIVGRGCTARVRQVRQDAQPKMQAEIDILEGIRAAYEQHERECERPPKAILMHAGNYELVGWDEALGLPVLPDSRPQPMHIRLVCGTGVGGYCAQGDVYWDEDGRPYIAEADLDPA